jgi:hypothetical protein
VGGQSWQERDEGAAASGSPALRRGEMNHLGTWAPSLRHLEHHRRRPSPVGERQSAWYFSTPGSLARMSDAVRHGFGDKPASPRKSQYRTCSMIATCTSLPGTLGCFLSHSKNALVCSRRLSGGGSPGRQAISRPSTACNSTPNSSYAPIDTAPQPLGVVCHRVGDGVHRLAITLP